MLQAAYVCAGTLFNLVSLFRERNGLYRLTPTQPTAGIRAMAIAACIIVSYFVVPPLVFAVAWLAFSIRLIIRSVVPHFLAAKNGKNIENYSSTFSATLALVINLIGSVFGLVGGIMAIT